MVRLETSKQNRFAPSDESVELEIFGGLFWGTFLGGIFSKNSLLTAYTFISFMNNKTDLQPVLRP